MNTYAVWHANDRNIRFFVTDEGQDAVRRGDMSRYVHVADVEVQSGAAPNVEGDLELVYSMTNSCEFHWSENKGVTRHGELARSTSVGDVLISADGRKWMVDIWGFLEVK